MTPAPSSGGGTRRRFLGDLAAGLLAALSLGLATWSLLGLGATFVVRAALCYLLAATVVAWAGPEASRGPGLGAANRITLVRLVIVTVLGALVLPPVPLGVVGRWWVIALGTATLVLDGVDGRIARRTGTESAFGARFDMETDALLMLVLSALVWTEGRAGPWVILIGAMRYLFVAAGWLLPALAGELYPSLRRRVVCVVQGVGLLVALGPIIPPSLATAAVGLALTSLGWSFAIDSIWLLRRDDS